MSYLSAPFRQATPAVVCYPFEHPTPYAYNAQYFFYIFRLTFYICALGFTSPMLFDDKKNPFHLMLQKFLQSGGQDAFFE
jgi:hypothetical protein